MKIEKEVKIELNTEETESLKGILESVIQKKEFYEQDESELAEQLLKIL